MASQRSRNRVLDLNARITLPEGMPPRESGHEGAVWQSGDEAAAGLFLAAFGPGGEWFCEVADPPRWETLTPSLRNTWRRQARENGRADR